MLGSARGLGLLAGHRGAAARTAWRPGALAPSSHLSPRSSPARSASCLEGAGRHPLGGLAVGSSSCSSPAPGLTANPPACFGHDGRPPALLSLTRASAPTDRLALKANTGLHRLAPSPRYPAALPPSSRSLSLSATRWQSPSPTPGAPPPPPNAKPASFARKPRVDPRLAQLQRDLVRLVRRRLPRPKTRRQRLVVALVAALAAIIAAYELSTTAQHGVIAVERCAVIAWAVTRGVMDYKALFRKTWDDSPEGHRQRHDDYEETHRRAATRLMEAMRQLGGIYIKLGQHLSTVQLVPLPWSQAMKPLQDQCFPTPLEALQDLFLAETGAPMSYFFSSFDPEPIGVASLAQVHRAVDRETGRPVAVKCMHPDIEEFSAIDMRTTTFLLGVVKRVFPDFEFTWLGEEMEANLPLEMDFRHEEANAARCVKDFSTLDKTTFVIPDVLWAKKRVMVMEFIQGARVDDLEYLARHKIDRNLVSREIAEITSRMIYITGFFHGDLHAGNLLIRPAQPGSRSPYNFEVVLLDHGLYFDLPSDLRVNYARFWLSLMARPSPRVEAERRHYAKEVANISDDAYVLFVTAISGRAAVEGVSEDGTGRQSMLEMGANTDEEKKKVRTAMVQQEGLLPQLFKLLRTMPRKLVMLFKVNDLNRALDLALETTHSPVRVFLIIASYCNLAIRLDDLAHLPPLSLGERFSSWWRYHSWKWTLKAWTVGADLQYAVERWRGRGSRELKLEL
ncbi:ABC1 family-domain-containing protein [Rhodotorula diobovata]|uniref:ABC1 family-domain-containing protein n=1 Tax=Rhodotorula diobovata TaxID=5288 RepID=A0A5C5G5C2_9BASI|nr:ABC1 family-domain-containing protein [Rhodotorula diobovata]